MGDLCQVAHGDFAEMSPPNAPCRNRLKARIAVMILTGAMAATLNAAEAPYGQALQMSLYFFEAQQSGHLSPSHRVSWRGDTHLDDGLDAGLDLSGGWYRGGDHWKSNAVMARATMMLAWSAEAFPAAYRGNGQLPRLLESLRHINTYFQKCVVDPHPNDPKNFEGFELYIDIGGMPGPAPDARSIWCAPEITHGFNHRESLKLTPQLGGPDVAGAMAGAMAASAVVFHEHGAPTVRKKPAASCGAHANCLPSRNNSRCPTKAWMPRDRRLQP